MFGTADTFQKTVLRKALGFHATPDALGIIFGRKKKLK